MPSAEFLPRTRLAAGVLDTESCVIDADSDQVAITALRFDNGADALTILYFVNDEFAGGGASHATHVETLNGPFAAGATFRARIEAPDEGAELALTLTWG